MRCPTCVAEGKTSVVSEIGEEATCMGCLPPFYDEAGRRHAHDPNTTTTHFTCSNGHRFERKWSVPCEVCDLVKAGVI